MGWTKTDHEGQTMWERDGERLKEPPDERPERVVERIEYYAGIDPAWLILVAFLAAFLGFIAGGILAAAIL